MSLRAILEISINLGSFRNIDLFQQGIYCLKLLLYHTDNNQQKVIAQPYSLISQQNQKRITKNSSKDYHNIIPSYIEDIDSTLITKAFLIRYYEEVAEINDFCQFRTEIEANQNYLQTEMHLEVNLLFADLMNLGGYNLWQNYIDNIQNLLEFKLLSTQNFVINKPLLGISEYFQIVFGETHFCSCEGIIHTTLIDYRFRVPQQIVKQQQDNPPQQNEKAQKSENLSNQKKKPETLAEFLFADQNGTMPYEVIDFQMDRVYDQFIYALKNAYDNLASTLANFQKICSRKQQKEGFQIDCQIPPLILPGQQQENVAQENKEEGKKQKENAKSEKQASSNQSVQSENLIYKKLSERLKTNRTVEVSENIIQELNMIAAQLFQL